MRTGQADVPAFDVCYYRTPRTLAASALRELVRGLPRTVYRVKGIARVTEQEAGTTDAEVMVHGVGRRLQLVRLPMQDADVQSMSRSAREPRDTHLVVIGAAGALDADSLQRAFDEAVVKSGP
jgi:G3E family GTPase